MSVALDSLDDAQDFNVVDHEADIVEARVFKMMHETFLSLGKSMGLKHIF